MKLIYYDIIENFQESLSSGLIKSPQLRKETSTFYKNDLFPENYYKILLWNDKKVPKINETTNWFCGVIDDIEKKIDINICDVIYCQKGEDLINIEKFAIISNNSNIEIIAVLVDNFLPIIYFDKIFVSNKRDLMKINNEFGKSIKIDIKKEINENYFKGEYLINNYPILDENLILFKDIFKFYQMQGYYIPIFKQIISSNLMCKELITSLPVDFNAYFEEKNRNIVNDLKFCLYLFRLILKSEKDEQGMFKELESEIKNNYPRFENELLAIFIYTKTLYEIINWSIKKNKIEERENYSKIRLDYEEFNQKSYFKKLGISISDKNTIQDNFIYELFKNDKNIKDQMESLKELYNDIYNVNLLTQFNELIKKNAEMKSEIIKTINYALLLIIKYPNERTTDVINQLRNYCKNDNYRIFGETLIYSYYGFEKLDSASKYLEDFSVFYLFCLEQFRIVYNKIPKLNYFWRRSDLINGEEIKEEEFLKIRAGEKYKCKEFSFSSKDNVKIKEKREKEGRIIFTITATLLNNYNFPFYYKKEDDFPKKECESLFKKAIMEQITINPKGNLQLRKDQVENLERVVKNMIEDNFNKLNSEERYEYLKENIINEINEQSKKNEIVNICELNLFSDSINNSDH